MTTWNNNTITAQELLSKYQEQNTEIIKTNIRLNERIAILESVISDLQRDNLQLRINSVMKERTKKKSNIIKRKNKNIEIFKKKKKITEEDQPLINNDNDSNNNKKRSCSNKPINYGLPSSKSKLRKGDPFTFGNET